MLLNTNFVSFEGAQLYTARLNRICLEVSGRNWGEGAAKDRVSCWFNSLSFFSRWSVYPVGMMEAIKSDRLWWLAFSDLGSERNGGGSSCWVTRVSAKKIARTKGVPSVWTCFTSCRPDRVRNTNIMHYWEKKPLSVSYHKEKSWIRGKASSLYKQSLIFFIILRGRILNWTQFTILSISQDTKSGWSNQEM